MKYACALAILLALCAVGCECEEESAPEKNAQKSNGKCVRIAGTWSVQTKVDKRGCDGGKIEKESLSLDFEQDGCAISVPVSLTGDKLTGTLKGNKLRLKGKYDDLVGTTTKDLKLTFDGKRFKGTGQWTYSTLGFKCKGTETLIGKL